MRSFVQVAELLASKRCDAVIDSQADLIRNDNGGRRLGIDRRVFSYDSHIPERRRGREQRSGRDRRSGEERRRVITLVRKASRDHRSERRSGQDRRVAFG